MGAAAKTAGAQDESYAEVAWDVRGTVVGS
jgi:hypothetical protein